MKTRLKIYCGVILCCGLAAGCSTTKNLPEEEVLYTGIKEIDYGQKSKKKAKKKAKQKEEEGVITSLADAYKAVDDLLTQRDLSCAETERGIELRSKRTPSPPCNVSKRKRMKRRRKKWMRHWLTPEQRSVRKFVLPYSIPHRTVDIQRFSGQEVTLRKMVIRYVCRYSGLHQYRQSENPRTRSTKHTPELRLFQRYRGL